MQAKPSFLEAAVTADVVRMLLSGRGEREWIMIA